MKLGRTIEDYSSLHGIVSELSPIIDKVKEIKRIILTLLMIHLFLNVIYCFLNFGLLNPFIEFGKDGIVNVLFLLVSVSMTIISIVYLANGVFLKNTADSLINTISDEIEWQYKGKSKEKFLIEYERIKLRLANEFELPFVEKERAFIYYVAISLLLFIVSVIINFLSSLE